MLVQGFGVGKVEQWNMFGLVLGRGFRGTSRCFGGFGFGVGVLGFRMLGLGLWFVVLRFGGGGGGGGPVD